MFDDHKLHVAVPYINPLRSRNRERLMLEFIARMEREPDVVLYVGEIAFGDRDFRVTNPCNPRHFRFRTNSELWHKERLINLIIQRFALDWRYGAYWDGDFSMSRFDWARETIHQLQHFPWVQPFSSMVDTNDLHHSFKPWPSFAYRYHRDHFEMPGGYALPFQKPRGECYMPHHRHHHKGSRWAGATGGGWAFTRETFEDCQGLLDTCVLGSADWHMSWALVTPGDEMHPDILNCGNGYVRSIVEWQQRAWKAVQGRIGYVDNLALHYWHGPRSKRGYEWRWQILRDHDYNPTTDLVVDSQGLHKFAGNKPRLELEFGRYMRSRNEDLPYIADQPLI